MNTDLAVVSQVLNVPDDGTWMVSDNAYEDKNLLLVNGKTSDSKVRGQIVDLALRKVVCPSFGIVYNTVSDHLPIRPHSGHQEIDLVDDSFKHHFFNLSECIIEDGYEGTIIRVWFSQSQGEAMYSTHKKINSKKSRWIVTKYFYDMYIELGGPTDLFDRLKSEDRSLDQVFFFLIVHPEVQVVSSRDIGSGKLIFLGTVWDQIRSERGENCEDVFGGNLSEEIRLDLETKFPRDRPLSLEEANERLRSTEKDYRIDGSNFIIISQGFHHMKVMTPGYMWRSQLRQEEPNLAFLWYQKVTDSYRVGRMALPDKIYFEKYPQLKQVDISSIKRRLDSGEPLNFEIDNNPSKTNSRLHNIFQTTLISISPSHRLQLMNIFQGFFTQKIDISTWIYELYQNPILIEELTRRQIDMRRIDQILMEVQKFAKERKNNRMNWDPITKSFMEFDRIVHDNIKNLIAKEAGNSLYRLLKTKQKLEKPEEN